MNSFWRDGHKYAGYLGFLVLLVFVVLQSVDSPVVYGEVREIDEEGFVQKRIILRMCDEPGKFLLGGKVYNNIEINAYVDNHLDEWEKDRVFILWNVEITSPQIIENIERLTQVLKRYRCTITIVPYTKENTDLRKGKH